ncbi:MAG: PilZ domain-containing protein [Bdellovibrionales bacterium]
MAENDDDKFIKMRKFPRFDTATKAQVRQIGLPDWNTCEIVNLSRGGAKIITSINYDIGTVVEVLVLSPDPTVRQHQIMAKVVWTTPVDCGLQFITKL